MIVPSDERAASGPAGFHDSVLVEFCDGERDVFGLLRIARVPEADSDRACWRSCSRAASRS